ncbi:tripartite tricarboxylate transporter substrate binding protein [Vibrio nitrifigilis]|uniref:Tripartite tricarboxylate transporter substrate binding protein n=1 Tax=Vibrio nitrifigilis TaxID=2789781 RepID=A0ABS0GDU1_9VIBR|nr:tripartite tricarboxylate transporter substrate binding protein [Vibrio nitrifigilis]
MLKPIRCVVALIGTSAMLFFSSLTMSAPLEELHLLIPGGQGGGWDMTAHDTGTVLQSTGLVKSVTYQNISGGGGGKAIAHLIETAPRQTNTLMINSTPIVLRSLYGVFPQSFHDLTPVASIISDYGAFVVPVNSELKTWDDVIQAFKNNPRSIKVAGGSARGSLDHLIAAAAFQGHGFNPRQVRYIAYDAGGKALESVMSGETQLLSTGFGEVIHLYKEGKIRILAITAPTPIASAPDVPTLVEYNNPFVFANWRGFFAAPNTSPAQVEQWVQTLKSMYKTPEWKKVRDNNGWNDAFLAQEDFKLFLLKQEQQMRDLLRELDFLR